MSLFKIKIEDEKKPSDLFTKHITIIENPKYFTKRVKSSLYIEDFDLIIVKDINNAEILFEEVCEILFEEGQGAAIGKKINQLCNIYKPPEEIFEVKGELFRKILFNHVAKIHTSEGENGIKALTIFINSLVDVNLKIYIIYICENGEIIWS